MTIYLKNLKENIIRINIRLKVSNFFPEGIIDIIKKKVPENNFILGVCYNTGDSQICISGHPKIDETVKQGANREIKEELSLNCLENLEEFKTVEMNTFFSIDLKDTEIEKSKTQNYNFDKKDRAIICVHGKEKDVLYYLANLEQFSLNEDNITSVWASEKENILKYLENKNKFIYPKER
jgi:hypothetical protein